MRKLRLTIVALTIGLSSPAWAQDDQLAQLRAEIGALSSLVAGLAGQLSGGGGAAPIALDGTALDQIERLRLELATLTGRTEALEFQIRRVVDDASNRIGDMEFRLTELEGGDTTALQQRPLGGGVIAAPTEMPETAAGERAAFEDAKTRMQSGDAADGMAALEAFLLTYPGSPFGAEASALLAQAQTAAGQDSDSARTWLNLYLSGPDGPSAPLALLELGEALGRLQQVAEACVMFDELLTRFPTAMQVDGAVAAKARLSCP
jgi:TolA-binding protein